MVHAIGEAHSIKKLMNSLPTLTTRQTAEEKRHLYIFIGRDLGKQVKTLKDEAHSTVSDSCQILPAQT